MSSIPGSDVGSDGPVPSNPTVRRMSAIAWRPTRSASSERLDRVVDVVVLPQGVAGDRQIQQRDAQRVRDHVVDLARNTATLFAGGLARVRLAQVALAPQEPQLHQHHPPGDNPPQVMPAM